MVDMAELKAANANRWANAKLTKNFISVAKSLVAAKGIYSDVQQVTKVPWWFVAVVHERESSQNWMSSLAQGDPWDAVSTHFPAGRGPFHSWKEAAIDALMYCSPQAGHNLDWSVGGTLTLLEQYNGLGYAGRGLPSPYLWSGTDQYIKGKYIKDHVFDPNVVDVQMGCAGLLLTMMKLDNSIQIGTTVEPPPAKPIIPPQIVLSTKPLPQRDSFSEWVKSWFT